jgi:hypothetical protein
MGFVYLSHALWQGRMPKPTLVLRDGGEAQATIMKRPNLNFLILWLSGCMLVLSVATASAAARRIISLDGTWQLAEGQTDQRPAQFDRSVPVPGLVDLARPAFAPNAFRATKRLFGLEDAELAKHFCWYRREFVLDGEVPATSVQS